MIVFTSLKREGKMLQKSGAGYSIYVSKEAVEKLKLKAQDKNCQLIEGVDKGKQQLIFQVVKT